MEEFHELINQWKEIGPANSASMLQIYTIHTILHVIILQLVKT